MLLLLHIALQAILNGVLVIVRRVLEKVRRRCCVWFVKKSHLQCTEVFLQSQAEKQNIF
jgi:hypothetical protein